MSSSNLTGVNRALKAIHEFNGTLRHVFTWDLSHTLPLSNPNDVHGGLIATIASQNYRLSQNVNILIDRIKTKLNDGLIDDKEYVIEDYVQLAASLPSDSKLRPKVTESFIKILWGSLRHPPQSFLGTTQPLAPASCEWRYRTADGSNNSRSYPQLGQAGSPYARTLAPRKELPPSLPDAGMLFDELFARGAEAREHPNRISSMLFYLASIIIHDCFRTNGANHDIVDSSSYLDLAPLYGHNQTEQNKIRAFQDGKLKPDCFSEYRMLGFPPGVAVLLICFNRFHNYIATELKLINEAGRFSPRGPDPDKRIDEDLFQTARLITCGLYINIVLIDYVRTILALNRSPSDWSLDPRVDITTKGPGGIPQGVGNQVSVEFNLVYRWHSAISKRDEQWSIDFFKEVLGGRDPTSVSSMELGHVFRDFLKKAEDTKPEELTFAQLKRDPTTGGFKDEDLVKILTESTEDVAGAFGARNVPVCMRAIEILGIEQARHWNVATLNEFRKYFGLVPHKTFSDISSDEEVARSLETLYGTPDMVELYPGLVAEDAKKPVVPGSGLCGGFTLTTGILADATALVRGDRFYTLDFNAASLTNWGFGEIQTNPRVAGGNVMYKLLMRAFPGWYKGNSVYAMFPFQVPTEQALILQSLGQEHLYDFTPPQHNPEPIAVSSYDAVTKILADQDRFKVPWGPNITYITKHDFMLAGDSPANAEQKQFIGNALSCPAHGDNDMKKLYYDITANLLLTKSRKLRHAYLVDLVADIGNISHALAAGQIWHYPLKTPQHPTGVMTASEFYTAYAICFAWAFLDLEPAAEFQLRHYAQQASEPITQITQLVVRLVQNNMFTKLLEMLGRSSHDDGINQSYGVKLIQRMSEGGKSVEEVAAAIIPTVTGMVATQAQGFAQMLDLFLSEKYYKDHWHVIEKLSRSTNPQDFEKLKKYTLEAFRLAPPAFGLLRDVAADGVVVQDGDKSVEFTRGDRVYTNFATAGRDPSIFPNPDLILLDRPDHLYINQGYGPHTCIGRNITVNAMASQLRACGQLENLRRAPGPQGELKYKTVKDSIRVYMRADGTAYWPFPTTMKVLHDGFSVEMEVEQGLGFNSRL